MVDGVRKDEHGGERERAENYFPSPEGVGVAEIPGQSKTTVTPL